MVMYIGSSCGAVKAHPAWSLACSLAALNAHPGAFHAPPGAMEAHPGAVEARPGALHAHLEP